MAFQSEIINSVKGPSIIRVADVGTATIALTDLRATPNTEQVLSVLHGQQMATFKLLAIVFQF